VDPVGTETVAVRLVVVSAEELPLLSDVGVDGSLRDGGGVAGPLLSGGTVGGSVRDGGGAGGSLVTGGGP
jgi:hypothetical protein